MRRALWASSAPICTARPGNSASPARPRPGPRPILRSDMVRRALLLGLLALVPAIPAAAQSTQGVDPDASTVQLGPIGITPSLLVKAIGRDENVFNEAVNPKS